MRQGSTTSQKLGGGGTWFNEMLSVFSAVFMGRPRAKPLRFAENQAKISLHGDAIVVPSILLKAQENTIVSTKDTLVGDVMLPLSVCLKRSLTVPKAARQRVSEIAALELTRRTPFKPMDVYAAAVVDNAAGQDLLVTQLVIRRSEVDALVSRLAKLGIIARKVLVDTGARPVELLDRTGVIAPRAALWQRINLGLLGIIALLALGLWLYPGWQARVALKRIEPMLGQTRADVVELRQKLDLKTENATSTERFLQQAILHSRLVEILRSLTISMPDKVWLSDILLRQGRLVVSGETSGSAADLVLALAKSRAFEDPRLSGPVSRTATGGERFQIAFGVGAMR